MRIISTVCLIWIALSTWGTAQSSPTLNWQALPPIPDELGLAGPVVGVYDNLLIVGGGANFAKPVWESVKQWHRELYVLDLSAQPWAWQHAGQLPATVAYSACASTPLGVVAIGGNDQRRESAQCWLFKPKRRSNGEVQVDWQNLPDLPRPLVYGQAAWVKDRVVVLTGQTGSELSSAIAGGWQLVLRDQRDIATSRWQPIVDCPGGARAFAMVSNMTGAPHAHKLLLMGGRRQTAAGVEFLDDVWEYEVGSEHWRKRTSIPVAVTAGGAGPVTDNFIAIVSGDDGSLFTQTDQLKDKHPGFAKRTWLFDVANDGWQAGPASPANQVTTPPVMIGNRLLIVSGEVRPRVRTNQAWQVTAPPLTP